MFTIFSKCEHVNYCNKHTNYFANLGTSHRRDCVKKLSLMFESKDKNGKSIFNKEIGDTISILVKTKDNRVQSAAVVVDTVNQDGCHEFKRIELEIIQSVIKEV